MGRPAIVDRKLAKRLRDDGWLYREIADYFGVSEHSARMGVKDDERQRQYASSLRWAKNQRKPCKECGKLIWMHVHGRSGLCLRCFGRTQAFTARPDVLLCNRCKEWKPDDDFPQGKTNHARRHRHALCRSCQTEARREYRWKYAKVCASCGGPRGGDSDYRAPMRRDRVTGLCKTCYAKSRVAS